MGQALAAEFYSPPKDAYAKSSVLKEIFYLVVVLLRQEKDSDDFHEVNWIRLWYVNYDRDPAMLNPPCEEIHFTSICALMGSTGPFKVPHGNC